jgi:hypothetical protein
MSKIGIMIAPAKKSSGMPPPTFGGKADRLPAPSPAADEPETDDETGETDAWKRCEDKLDEILSLLKNDSAGDTPPDSGTTQPGGMQ